MGDRSLKTQDSASKDANLSPRLRVAGWIASMVLVALLTVFVNYEFADDALQTETSPKPVANAQRKDAIVESSPDTQIVASAARPANDRVEATKPTEPRIMPGLKLANRQGLVALAGARRSPSDDMTRWCQTLAERVNGLASNDCMRGDFVDSGADSVNGRPLVMRHIQPSSPPGRGRVMLIAATHGDEPSSVALVFGWMKMMAERGSAYAWQVLPLLNPDGMLHQPSTRVNANGVDLNRNLPTVGWARQSRDYWRRVGFEKRRFPGESAGSEPENQWLVENIKQFQPDVIVTAHAPYSLLDYDGDFPAPQKLGRLDLHRLGVYPGSLGNFGFRMNNVPVITIELANAEEAPGQAEVAQMYNDLEAWLDRYFRNTRQARAGAGRANAG